MVSGDPCERVLTHKLKPYLRFKNSLTLLKEIIFVFHSLHQVKFSWFLDGFFQWCLVTILVCLCPLPSPQHADMTSKTAFSGDVDWVSFLIFSKFIRIVWKLVKKSRGISSPHVWSSTWESGVKRLPSPLHLLLKTSWLLPLLLAERPLTFRWRQVMNYLNFI